MKKKKSNLIDTPSLLTLHHVQYNLNFDTFKSLFGFYADHLWERFSESYNYNLLGFFHYLDLNNKEILCKYINNED